MGAGGRVDRRLPLDLATGEGAVAGVQAGRPPAVAEGGTGARPQTTRYRTVGEVAQCAHAGVVARLGAKPNRITLA